MQTQNLPKIVARSSKRLGRGYGSGKGGHTSSRGQKGQKARGSVGVLFEGLKVKKSLLRRLPFLRGKSKFSAYPKPLAVSLDQISKLNIPEGTEINADFLVKAGVLNTKKITGKGVKIIGGKGKFDKKITVAVPTSKQAQEFIVKAGGKVI